MDWEDWRWQLRNRIRTKDVLAKIVNLTDLEDQDGSSETSIVKVLQPGEYGINPVEYLPEIDSR